MFAHVVDFYLVDVSFDLDCGNPQPANGTVNGSEYTFGKAVEVACDTGYELSGSAVITCQSSGIWSDSPTCNAKGNINDVKDKFSSTSCTYENMINYGMYRLGRCCFCCCC